MLFIKYGNTLIGCSNSCFELLIGGKERGQNSSTPLILSSPIIAYGGTILVYSDISKKTRIFYCFFFFFFFFCCCCFCDFVINYYYYFLFLFLLLLLLLFLFLFLFLFSFFDCCYYFIFIIFFYSLDTLKSLSHLSFVYSGQTWSFLNSATKSLLTLWEKSSTGMFSFK